MTQGLVYTWTRDSLRPTHLHARTELVTLPNLDRPTDRDLELCGRFVVVRNAGAVNVPAGDGVRPEPLGNATVDAQGRFVFAPGRGGGRLDKTPLAPEDVRWRYRQAAHFGEVNAYYHVDRIASYVDDLLADLGAQSLPRVTVVVNAHHAATDLDEHGRRDGIALGDRWLPFQGGHYRLPGKPVAMKEHQALSPHGEIHLGPGRKLVNHGALAQWAGSRYRANASHNPGILYHEYGHHITRHTADLAANRLRPAGAQDNRKTALDEGMSDYWAATMLGTPHIWTFHHRHDAESTHGRSLLSSKTMADYDATRRADPHDNGTIWAAMLWDVRMAMVAAEKNGARQADRLVLAALLRLGDVDPGAYDGKPGRVRRARSNFATAAQALLLADATVCGGRYASTIRSSLRRRAIPVEGEQPDPGRRSAWPAVSLVER